MDNLKKKYFVNVTNIAKSVVPNSPSITVVVTSGFAKIKEKFNQHKDIVESLKELKDKFYDAANKKFQNFAKIVDQLEKDVQSTIKKVEDVLISFGVETKDPKFKNPEEFFKLIDEFMDQIEKFTPKTEPQRVVRKHEVGAKVS